MAQHFVYCRDYIDDGECSVVIGAGTLEEVVETAIEHAHANHAEEDTPALRAYIRQNIREAATA